MHKLGDLLENAINQIENRVKEDINADFIADSLGISSIHLQRLFKFAFKQPLGSYIRSRKLTVSLENLFNTNSKIVDIALDYSFEYEETYIRAFKREFGVTPGIARRTSQIIKITPPLNLSGASIFKNCIIFEPEIVMVPQFHVIGRKYQVPISDLADTIQKTSKLFCENERNNIINTTEPDVFIGLIGKDDIEADYQWYLPSIQVKALKNIPEGFEGYTLNHSLYAKFRYIGQHHYLEINRDLIINSHSAMVNRFNYEYDREYCVINGIFFVKVYGLSYDGNFCQVEYFAPIKKKINDEKHQLFFSKMS